jgi:hypothetical protein
MSEDHDAVIKLRTSVKILCGKVDKFIDNNRADHEKINDLLVNQIIEAPKTFLSSKTFYWVAGFLIIGLLSVGASTIDNRVEIKELHTIGEHHDNQLPGSETTEIPSEDG